MTNLLTGKKALVTGSSRGIGRATALAMAQAGADVVIHYHRQKAEAEAVAQQIQNLGRETLILSANLEEADAIDEMFDHIARAWGALDIFMANAAATAFKPIMDLKPHHLDRTYSLLVHGLVHSVQRAVPLMEGRPGRIITISGHGIPFTLPLYATIGSAKGAVEALTRYLAYELGPKGITCNTIAPGVVDTDSARFYMADRYPAFNRSVSLQTPLGRMASPEDVAAVALFLSSDLSRFVTGQVIRVDGGLTLTSGPFEQLKNLSEP